MFTIDAVAAIPPLPDLDLPFEAITDPMGVDTRWLRPNGVVARFPTSISPELQREALDRIGARVAGRLVGGELLLAISEGEDAGDVARRLRESGLVTFCRPMRILAAHRAKAETLPETVSRDPERSPWRMPEHRCTVRHGRGLVRRSAVGVRRSPIADRRSAFAA
jgi:hypothetical protein